MWSIEESVRIDRAPEAVWEWITTPGSLVRWAGAVQTAEFSGERAEVGAHIRGTSKVMGRTFAFENEITALEPAKLLEGRSVKAPFPMTIRYELSPEQGGTRFVYRLETPGLGGFFGKLADGMVMRKYSRQVRDDLATLKQVVEAEV